MGHCISVIFNERKTALLDEDILSAEYKTSVPFAVQIEWGKVVKVYDGDTITVAAKLPYSKSPVYRFTVRLRGIDTPEIKGHCEKERDAAKIARDALHSKIFGRVVNLKNIGTEKYGRMLADIYLDDLHINRWLLDSKYAVPYDGKKKQEWIFDG